MSDEQAQQTPTTPETPAAQEAPARAPSELQGRGQSSAKVVGHKERKRAGTAELQSAMAAAAAEAAKPAETPAAAQETPSSTAVTKPEPPKEAPGVDPAAKTDPAPAEAPAEPEKTPEPPPAAAAPEPAAAKPMKLSHQMQIERIRRQEERRRVAIEEQLHRERTERAALAQAQQERDERERQREARDREWQQKALRDPDGALAERLGIDRRNLLAARTDKQAGEPPPLHPAVAAEMAEMRRRLEEREALDAAREKQAQAEAKQRAEQERVARHQADIAGDIRNIDTMATSDVAEHFAALPEKFRHGRIDAYLAHCIRHYQRTGEKFKPAEVVEALELEAAEIFAAQAPLHEKRMAAQSAAQNGGQGKPPPKPKAPNGTGNGETPRAPTARDAAAPAAHAAPVTHKERRSRGISELQTLIDENNKRA